MPGKLETLKNFLDTINRPNGDGWEHYHDVAHLITLFSADNGNLPFVGVTLRGPQFKNRANIETLFVQLLNKTFPDMAWTLANELQMTDGNTIAIEVDVTGTQHDVWFQDKFKSLPLSQIDALTLAGLTANNQNYKMDLPACVVFTFDAQDKIQQVAIYLDRYRMIHQLAPPDWKSIHLPAKHRSSASPQ